ncbi:MAG: hypothetical protein ACM3YE_07070 [Bacteroidota bacterium]
MMDSIMVFTETVITSVEPKRAFKAAEECLIGIRVIESKKEALMWFYEYEVKGEIGKIEKFLARIKSLEILK